MSILSTTGSELPLTVGGWWIDEEAGLHSADPIPSHTENFFFHQFKMVKIDMAPNEISVQWIVDGASRRAVEQAWKVIESCSDDIRVNLQFYLFGWASERRLSKRAALTRIETIQAREGVKFAKSVIIRRHELAEAERDSRLLRNGLEIWRRSRGRLGSVELSLLAANGLIFRPRRSDGLLTYAHIGAQTDFGRFMGAEWIRQAQGKPCEPVGAANVYDRSVSRKYYDVLASGEPEFDHIRATMTRRADYPQWRTYRRLLLPFRTRRGRPVLVCLSRFGPVSIPDLV